MMHPKIAQKIIDLFAEAKIPPEEMMVVLAGLLKSGVKAIEEETGETLMDEIAAYFAETPVKGTAP